MKKKYGLVLIEANALVIWLIRSVCVLLVILNCNTLMDLFQDGSFYRRGNFYTLADNPTSFYVRVTKYAVFAFLALWYLIIGTKVKNET